MKKPFFIWKLNTDDPKVIRKFIKRWKQIKFNEDIFIPHDISYDIIVPDGCLFDKSLQIICKELGIFYNNGGLKTNENKS